MADDDNIWAVLQGDLGQYKPQEQRRGDCVARQTSDLRGSREAMPMHKHAGAAGRGRGRQLQQRQCRDECGGGSSVTG